MPTYDADDDSGEDLAPSEYPEVDEDEDEDDDGTAPCSHCGKDRYEDCERCPHCGSYQSREDHPSRPPLWIVLGALACLGVAVMWALGR